MKRGLTLIELILVVAIMTTLGILSVPMYSRFLTQNAVGEASVAITGALRKAQFYALMSRKGSGSGWEVYYLANPSQEMVLYQGGSYAARVSSLDEKTKLPGKLNVSNFEVNFTRVTGKPGASLTIGVSGQGTARNVTVNAIGMVAVENL